MEKSCQPKAVMLDEEKELDQQENAQAASDELAPNGETKTIIRIEVDNFTNILCNSNIFHEGIGKDNKRAFKQIRKQVVEMLNSPTVKVYVETIPKLKTEDKNALKVVKKNVVNFVLKTPCQSNWRSGSEQLVENSVVASKGNITISNLTVKEKWPKEKKCSLSKGTRRFLERSRRPFIEALLRQVDKLKHGRHIGTIEKDLISIMRTIFPEKLIDIYFFGSRLYGMATKESDLDIYIDIDHTLYNFEDFPSAVTLDKVVKCRRALSNENQKDDIEHEKALSETRIPTLRVRHHKSGIYCKLYFSSIMGKTKSMLLEYIFKLQPIARTMCLYLQIWKQRAFLDAHINTYSLNLMVIFYLQSLNVLPSIEKLQRDIDYKNSVMVGPWICSYVPLVPLDEFNLHSIDSVFENCMDLVYGFFDFYAHFKYDSEIICPYWGRSLDKEEFESFMPYRYMTHVTNSLCNLEINRPVVLQDPIQLNHNVLENLTLNDFDKFKNKISDSFDFMSEQRK